MRAHFPSLRAGETKPLRFDFGAEAAGIPLTSAACNAYLYSGVDSAPAAILAGIPSIAGQVVTQRARGLAGNLYNLECQASDASGNVYISAGMLAVTSFNVSTTPPGGIVGGGATSMLTVSTATYIASAGQATFASPIGYTGRFIFVFVNGAEMTVGDDYALPDGTNVVLAVPAPAGYKVSLSVFY